MVAICRIARWMVKLPSNAVRQSAHADNPSTIDFCASNITYNGRHFMEYGFLEHCGNKGWGVFRHDVCVRSLSFRSFRKCVDDVCLVIIIRQFKTANE